MSNALRVLIVEDSEDDALLLAFELRTAGYDPTCTRVDTAAAMEAALVNASFDLVISDHHMNGFSSQEALSLVQASGLDLPFIIVSGAMLEDVAVAMMKAGAHDYLVKGNLARLVPAIERELREAAGRRERRRAEQALRESEAQFRAVFNQAAVGIAQAVSDGTILIINPKCCEILGYTQDQLVGRTFKELAYPGDLDWTIEYRQQLDAGLLEDISVEKRYLRGDGRPVWVNITASVIRNESKALARYIVAIEDISERKAAEEKIRTSEANLAAAQRITHLGSWELNLDDLNNMHKNHLRWSDETFRIFGYEPGEIEVTNDNFFSAVHPDDRKRISRAIAQALKDGTRYSIVHRIIRPDGSERIVEELSEIELDPVTGKPVKMVGTVQDITERKQYESRIEHLATHDALTTLPNRSLLNDRLMLLISRAERTKGRIAVLFLDVDRFKFINDNFGHEFGDRLLKQISFRLKESVRECDTVARLSGDEFVVVLADLRKREDALEIAHKLVKAFSHPFLIGQHELNVTASIGVSIYPDDGPDGEVLLRNADTAMYLAKEQGRNSLGFYTQEMSFRSQQRVELENGLRQALENSEFELHYQPQVSLWSGEVSGVEALIRWRHPKLGVISPDHFIPLAEETGLILPIEEWVLRTACAQLRIWHQAGHSRLSVAINLSARLFNQPDFPQFIRNILNETGLDPEYLDIELTEGTLMRNSDAVARTMRELKSFGVMLSLDDFGTGYSSLSYLKRFPIDILKVHKSFVENVGRSPDDAAICRVIIDMARFLRMRIIAEGVETDDQVDFLVINNCDAIQGYYFSPPLLADSLTALLNEGKQLWLNARTNDDFQHTLLLVPDEGRWELKVGTRKSG